MQMPTSLGILGSVLILPPLLLVGALVITAQWVQADGPTTVEPTRMIGPPDTAHIDQQEVPPTPPTPPATTDGKKESTQEGTKAQEVSGAAGCKDHKR